MCETGVLERAVERAQEWLRAGADGRFGGVLTDADGAAFAIAAIDGVLRPESLAASAREMNRLAPLAPHALPWYVRGPVRAGGVVAPVLPAPTVPLARRALRDMLSRVVLDARPAKLTPALARLRAALAAPVPAADDDIAVPVPDAPGDEELPGDEDGSDDSPSPRPDSADDVNSDEDDASASEGMDAPVRVAVRPIGAAVLGDDGAERRLAAARTLLDSGEVDEVIVSLTDAFAPRSPWAFTENVEEAVGYLAPLAVLAADRGVHLAIETTDPRAIDFAVAVVTLLYEDPLLAAAPALFALPGDVAAWRELRAWARARDADVTLRLVAAQRGTVGDLHRGGGALDPLMCLDEALHPGAGTAVSVSDHDLVHLAAATLLAAERGRTVDAVVPVGIHPGLREAITRDAAHVTVDVPVAAPGDLDLPFVARRLSDLTADVAAPAAAAEAITHPESTPDDASLTQAVLGIARGEETAPIAPVLRFGGDEYVETAVFARREGRHFAAGAPGFQSASDTDPVTQRAWARAVIDAVTDVAGAPALAPVVPERVRAAAAEWSAHPAADRALVLDRVGAALQERRAALIEAAAADTGALFAEADADVTAAIDAVRFASATARGLDAVSGAVFVPAELTLVAVDAVGAVRAAAEGIASALAAGSGVILRSPATRCGALLVEAFRAGDVPVDVLVVAPDPDTDDAAAEAEGAQVLDAVDRVVLHGSRADAVGMRQQRPDLPIAGDTAGPGAVIVMPSADLDDAARDLATHGFGRGRSAVSTVILVGAVAASRRFSRQLADAVRSLRVGAPGDACAQVGPRLVALSDIPLPDGDSWLVEPRRISPDGRLWSPGVRLATSASSLQGLRPLPEHAPVITIVSAASLAEARERQNATCAGGVAGLYTRDPDDLDAWLEGVEAGSLFVNRAPAGARAQRRCAAGWNDAAVGFSAPAGHSLRVGSLGAWRAADGAAHSSTLHLRGLDTRIASLIESAQPTLDYPAFEWLRRGALSDAVAWRRDFGHVRDEAQLPHERNLVRFRPVAVEIRAEADAAWHRLLRVVVAGIRAASPLVVSAPLGLPAAVRQLLGASEVTVFVETDEQWIERVSTQRPPRVRLVGRSTTVARTAAALAEAIDGDPGVAIDADEVTTAGRVELMPFVRAQAITIRAERFGAPDPWSEAVV